MFVLLYKTIKKDNEGEKEGASPSSYDGGKPYEILSPIWNRMEDLQVTLAMLFKRKGKNVLTEKEFVFSASIDFRWFSPKDAKRLLQMGMAEGLLREDGEYVRLAFDPASVDVPVGFKPEQGVLSADTPEPLFPRILALVVENSVMGRREAVASINRTRERLDVEIEVAGLAVARGYGADVSGLLDEVREEILHR